MGEQSSWVLLPSCSPSRHSFPVKAPALSACGSPWTIHFWVLYKSPFSGPGKGPPSHSFTRTSIQVSFLPCHCLSNICFHLPSIPKFRSHKLHLAVLYILEPHSVYKRWPNILKILHITIYIYSFSWRRRGGDLATGSSISMYQQCAGKWAWRLWFTVMVSLGYCPWSVWSSPVSPTGSIFIGYWP